MPTIYGDAFSASDPLKKGGGSVYDADHRRYRTVVNLATAGGGSTDPVAVKVPRGANPDRAVIRAATGVNLSGFNISVGKSGAAAYFSAAAAGPNAVPQAREFICEACDDEPLTAETEVLFTPASAWPASGIIVFDVYASKRG